MSMRKFYLGRTIGFVVVIFLVALYFFFFKENTTKNKIVNPGDNEAEQVFCTMEAKECPDGSFVGRVGPNCEFAPCPSKVQGKISVGSSLDLSQQGLSALPKYVVNQVDLESLDLSSNNLTGALPAEIRQLKNLKVLNISHNKMTGVPAEIGQLSQLEILDLSYNQFTGLPYELGNLSKLKTLILTGNDYARADLEIIKDKLGTQVNIIVD